MKRITSRQLALAFLLLSGLIAGAADKLESDFADPPADARPHTWWHWVNGNVTKEGITADLEAMARVGVGGAQIFNVAQHDKLLRQYELPGPIKTLSQEWRADATRDQGGRARRRRADAAQLPRLERVRRAVGAGGAVHAKGGLERNQSATPGPAMPGDHNGRSPL